ncbi:MAG: enoyl-CoA hydratase/isomerase family protein [Desulfomonile sp.]|nr:enoyl-CoA hydratase/isomerase family protein [Desulfomonile sp.]
MSEPVKVILCGETATVVINRPQAYNAFDLDTIDMVAEHLVNLAADDTVKAVVITGEGKAFCAGGDLRWASSWPHGPASAFHNLAARYHQAVLEIRRMPKPVLAAINGIAAGGGFSLALACDFRIMEKSAVMRQAYTSNGLSIDGGGTFTLPRLVGLARALEICAFDKPITADQALKWGLVTKVVPDGRSLEDAILMATELTERSLNSFRCTKQLLTDSFGNSFEEHLELERAALRACAAHADGQEGMQAFLEKRKPEFNRW